jgi:uncharacterized protein YggU (UPF0235/DUF167 family)
MKTTSAILRMAKKKKIPASAPLEAAMSNTTSARSVASSLLTGALVPIPDHAGLYRMNIHVKPGANSTSIVAPMPLSMSDGGPLEIRIGAPPEGGKANKELVEFLDEVFARAAAALTTSGSFSSSGHSGPRAPTQQQQQQRVSVDVRVAHGMTSRCKVIEVAVKPKHGMSDVQLWAALADAMQ